MGQYYQPTILKKNWKTAKNGVAASLKCYDFGNGAKLMEHSYVGNEFVAAVSYLLSLDKYFGLPFVWCGDYADDIKTNLGERNIYNEGGDFIYDEGETNTNRTKAYNELLSSVKKANYQEWGDKVYIVNLTKKQYVKVPKYKKNEWAVHPLPLLTCVGNGRGCGDYMLDGYELDNRIGSWAFDRIGVVKDIACYKDFNEIDGHWESDMR